VQRAAPSPRLSIAALALAILGGSPKPPVDFDVQRHLSRLLPEVNHINITGHQPAPRCLARRRTVAD